MSELEHITRLAEAYLADELSAEERKAFEARVETDPEFASEVRLHFLADAEIKAEGRALLKQSLNKRYEQALREQHTPVYLRPAAWGVAASILLLITLGIFFLRPQTNTPTTDQLIAEYWEVPEVSRFRDRVGDTLSTGWNKALDYFEDSAYNEAIPLFQELQQDSSFMADYGDRTRLYLAISYEKTQAFPEALAALASISDESIYVDQRIWYQAMVYLKMKDFPKAQELLQEIIDNPSHFKHTEAQRIWEFISKTP